MTTIEVKIARNDTHVATIAKKTEDESLAQFVENLQQAKQETNELLTTLVEADKLKQSEQPTEATKRKTSEPVQGGKAAKRNAGAENEDDDGSNDGSSDE